MGILEDECRFFWKRSRTLRMTVQNDERLQEVLDDIALLRDMTRHAGLRVRCTELLNTVWPMEKTA